MGFEEIADRVWVLRHPWYDLNVTAIGGERGMVVVDTHASAVAAREVVDALARLGPARPVAVVNTHEHFDHTFGNATFLEEYGELPVHATEEAAARTVPAGERAKEAFRESDDPRAGEVLATEVRPADHTFSSAAVVDLGDRQVELVHPGRGHTAGDLVVRVPDADVLLAGDLVEESAPPGMGPDCWPLEWATTLDLVLGLLTPASVVVPGHGAVVDRRFVEEQCDDLRAVGETIRNLASRGVPQVEALASAQWPWPVDLLHDAVARGYAQLPRGARRLPMA
ncbi:glyoxylase-like metal-dependent hydrolase (beta-lactamase superfamily II) [Nocardioides sp. J9]|uniref:MBL fold metallo-hydrolase n=1 Tax=Nocardioides sp. J9 TaxID=935844 RepID=UPI0011AD32F6|nr:MBL fold metallo-hydrolase [Nocardioides sp. J9]TWG89980.1 glyoxylase-like metal-dependent hydrolase (beta-lactamase superfamily II) [Nocardioides sp. J9]